jgi:mutator protein MutT
MKNSKIHHVVSVTFLIEKNGRFLLVKRGENEDYFGGKWTFPGGKVEKGEDVIKALLREVKEETGLEIQRKAAFLRSYCFMRKDGSSTIGLVFCLKYKKGKVNLDKSLKEFAWVSPKELHRYDIIPGIEIHLKNALEALKRNLFMDLKKLSKNG